MAEPSPKAAPIEAFLSLIAGASRAGSIRADVCVLCGGDASTFRDAMSRKEFSVSGMCQKCQDSVFGGSK